VAAGVLQEVGRQLLFERALVALEALAVLGAEPDGVLVRHVDASDGRGPVGVHLLRELARDFDRLHLRGEGTREHPFDEVFDPCFEVSKDADGDSPWRVRTRAGPRPDSPRGWES
jgi:hypothetical protein